MMDLSTALLLLLFFFIGLYLLSGRRRRNLPPGPPGLPIVGNFVFFSKIKQYKERPMADILMEMSKTYGPIISVSMFNRLTVFIHGYDAIHQAFVKQSDVFSDRPFEFVMRNSLSLKDGKGVLWESGSAWKLLKRFTLQTLRDFGVGKTSLEAKIIEEMNSISECLTEADGGPVNLCPIMAKAITNVIYGINFGSRFQFTDPVLTQLIEQLDILFEIKGQRYGSLLNLLPPFVVDYLPGETARSLKRRREADDWIRAHFLNQIEQHKESFDSTSIQDFVDLYIQTSRKNEKVDDVDGITERTIFRVIKDLFIAGAETTFSTLNWSILYMLQYPDVQTRCQQELDEVAPSRNVQWSDMKSCQYIEATLMEIQRLSNVAPTSVPHTARVDTTLMGYDIPKGTFLLANLISSNKDPKHWKNPDTFDPARFLTEEGKIKRVAAFLPFSTGPRACLGEPLAKMELFLIFSSLLQRFTFNKESSGIKLDFTPILDMATNAPKPYRIRATSRVS